jgi:penicillin amidase
MFRNLSGASAFVFAVIGAMPAQAQSSNETWQVEGLAEPAEIIVDRWGLAHLYARSPRDAYFLQGYNVARDRLWQIDLWRKRGLGLLAESFGAAYVKQDRATRLFLYRGDMADEWRSYGPDARDNYAAFVAGINAYVGEVLAGKKPLPAEFKLTDSKPSRWAADDVVRIRSNALVYNAGLEVRRARLLCKGGPEADRLSIRLYPPHTPKVPEGLDPCSVDAAALEDYALATGQVSFDELAPTQGAVEPPTAVQEGSNNWVIGGTRTTTGRPILANDPHRLLTVPSLRYVVHLEAPGLSLIGAGEPSVPGISLGHNGKGAFGLTIFAIDQEDVYLYETRPGDPESYRYGEGWEKMRIIRETIPVKGGEPVSVELPFTRHGPVVHRNRDDNRAYAIRSVWSQPGASAYAGAAWLANAASWTDFVAAADRWGAPPLNLIWADKSGTIGWQAAGIAPIRPNWDGLMPVPGDGRYEWRGTFAPTKLPSVMNPEQGYIATANEDRLTPFGVPDVPISFEFSDPTRAKRLAQMFSAKQKFSVADAAAMQLDKRNLNALRLIALLQNLKGWDQDSVRAIDLLREWNGDSRADSAAAAIAETWLASHLGRALAEQALRPEARALIPRPSADAALLALETGDTMLGSSPAEVTHKILRDGLTATLEELRGRLGPDMSAWRWGDAHPIELKPGIAALASPEQIKAMTVGPAPVGGSVSTVALAQPDAELRTIAGPSVRVAIDVGDWDKSVFMNMPGQSADPASPYYRNFLPGWLDGTFAPMVYTRPAVEAAAARVIKLTPYRPAPED